MDFSEKIKNFFTNHADLEKFMQFRWCAAFISAILFFDCFLAIQFQASLRTVSWDWIKTHIGLSELIFIILFYTVTFSVLLPFIDLMGRLLAGKLLQGGIIAERKERCRYYTIEELKIKAMKENNSSMYQDAIEQESYVRDRVSLRLICESIIVLSMLNWFVSNSDYLTIVGSYLTWLKSAPSLWRFSTLIVVALLVVTVFGTVFERRGFDKCMFIEKNEL